MQNAAVIIAGYIDQFGQVSPGIDRHVSSKAIPGGSQPDSLGKRRGPGPPERMCAGEPVVVGLAAFFASAAGIDSETERLAGEDRALSKVVIGGDWQQIQGK